MDVFLLTLLLVFAIALGGRDQLVMAQLADRLGRSPLLLATGVMCAAFSAGAMAWAATSFAALMPYRAAQMLVAFALALAAFELALPVRVRAAAEPTRSLGAIALVLLARQIGDGARFVVFAFAALAHFPLLSAIGGALGGAAALAVGWLAGATTLSSYPLVWWRRGLAVCAIIAAILLGVNARYPAA
jgi:Ca2+/H+ antiporter, TMEM165/GDT1 family